MAADLSTRETKRDGEEPQHKDRLEDGAAEPVPIDLLELGQKLQIIPVPDDGDGLETTAQRMEDLAKVVRDGNSLALYTGLKLAPTQPQNPEKLAVSTMTAQERMMYNAWKTNRKSDQSSRDPSACQGLRPFDWDANVAPVPTGAQSHQKFAKRAAAMDLVWGHEGATPEHAAWLTFHMPSGLPLVNAVNKIINLTKHMEKHDPQTRRLRDGKAAELETIRQIIMVAERNRSRELERIRTMTRSIAESVATLKSRVHNLETGTPE